MVTLGCDSYHYGETFFTLTSLCRQKTNHTQKQSNTVIDGLIVRFNETKLRILLWVSWRFIKIRQ